MRLRKNVSLLPLTLAAACTALLAGPAAADQTVARAPAMARTPASVTVVQPGMTLTRAQLDAMPDARVFEFRGEKLTVSEIKKRLTEAEARHAAARRVARDKQAHFAAFRLRFLDTQKAKLAEERARGLAEYERLKAQHFVGAPR